MQGIEQGLWGVGAVGCYLVARLTPDLATGCGWSGIPVVGQCVTIRQGLQQHRGHVLAILLFRATAFPGDGYPVAVIDRAHIHPQRTAAGPGDDGRNELPAALDSGRRHPAVGEQLPALVQAFGGDVRLDVGQGRNHARIITLACPLFPVQQPGQTSSAHMSVLAGTDHFRELEEGYGGDVYGKRYLPGPLHMLMGDVAGALASFDLIFSTMSPSIGS